MNARNILFKAKLPSNLPKDLSLFIKRLKKENSKNKCVKLTYDFLLTKYRGHRLKTYLRFFEIFVTDVDKIWTKRGFLHCTALNYLMRVILIKSGHFSDEDIRIRWTLVLLISPHQYLQIRLSKNKLLNVDLWGNAYGILYGDYAKFFNQTFYSKN